LEVSLRRGTGRPTWTKLSANAFTISSRTKGCGRTIQRDAIIRAAFNTTEHYTAEDLLIMARKIERSVSRATVYRTLPLLVECGVLKELDFGKDYKFYDPNYIDHPGAQPPDLRRLQPRRGIRGSEYRYT
jgi:hypothetical protein